MRTLRIALMGLLTVLTLSNCGFETVDTGRRGLWLRFGEVVGEPINEGLYFYNPFVWDVVEYPVREQSWSSKTEIFTKDTQRVDMEFTVVFYPDPKKVGQLYKEIGWPDDLASKIIQPVVLGSVKDAIGQVIADELVGKREAVRSKAFTELKVNLAARSIFATDLQFTNISFDKAYEQAVEMKVVAIQEAQKAKNESVRIREEAEQKIMTAKADAESMRIKSQALAQNKGLVQFEAVQKWDGKLPQYMFGNATPFIDMRNIGKQE